MRSWLFGAKLAERRTLKPELVAVSVLLHDLGLARGGAPDRRFEVVGADAGRAFALSHNMGERRAETVWDSIALHTTASIAHHKGTGKIPALKGMDLFDSLATCKPSNEPNAR